MQWADVIADATLRDLPYKIELDRWGNIVMIPASNWHGRLKCIVGGAPRRSGYEVIFGCAIETSQGVKVADVAWCSDDFLAAHGYETPYTAAPEICVDVRSPSNSRGEIDEKIRLYLEAGAREVWIVFEDGRVCYFDRDGEKTASCWEVDCAALLRLKH